MIAQQERNEALAKLASTQNEELFQRVLELLRQQAGPDSRTKSGFLKNSVLYHTAEWDAPVPDADWAHNDPAQ